jgi:ribosomal-protein-alanine N-acetyltransferase
MMIRLFNPSDVYKIADLTHVNLREDYPMSFFLNIAHYWPEGFIIAEKDGDMVGFIMGVISGIRQSRILMLAVREQYRKQGIASALIRSFISSSMLKGTDTVILEVRITNGEAITLYSKLGFRTIGSLRAYYKDGEDGLRMQLVLQT